MHIVNDDRKNLGLGVKGQGQLKHCCIKPCWHDTDYRFCPITFKLYMHIVGDEWRNSIDLGLRGQRSRSTLALLYKTLWADYSFCPITFKLHMHVVDEERRNSFDFGSLGQRSTLGLSFWNLVGGMQATVFAQSLPNFVCKLLMMRGETLLILGRRANCRGQLWPPARGCHALHCLVNCSNRQLLFSEPGSHVIALLSAFAYAFNLFM